ncbi:MAG: hypothetical protein H7Y09_02890 [Chitinophagaceae bacterium]|nr:hypothetical protein [Anaerolineae bacterium]
MAAGVQLTLLKVEVIMLIQERVDIALNNENACLELGELVNTLSCEGYSKIEIHRFFLNFHLFLRENNREQHEDLVAECVLDRLVGFCSPHYRLLPQQPDMK